MFKRAEMKGVHVGGFSLRRQNKAAKKKWRVLNIMCISILLQFRGNLYHVWCGFFFHGEELKQSNSQRALGCSSEDACLNELTGFNKRKKPHTRPVLHSSSCFFSGNRQQRRHANVQHAANRWNRRGKFQGYICSCAVERDFALCWSIFVRHWTLPGLKEPRELKFKTAPSSKMFS